MTPYLKIYPNKILLEDLTENEMLDRLTYLAEAVLEVRDRKADRIDTEHLPVMIEDKLFEAWGVGYEE